MTPAHAFAVSLLESSLSAQAAGVALELRGTLGAEACERLGRFDDLSADARMRLRYLIEAVALDCPGLYADFLAWQRTTHAARELEPRILASAVAGQRRVLAQGLPRAAFATLEPLLAAGEARLAAAPVEPVCATDGPHGTRVAEMLECALTGKRAEFLALARRMVEGLGEEIFVEDVLVGVLSELGRLWQLGEIHVGEEHLVSRLVEDALAQLQVWRPSSEGLERRALIAAPSGDLHELGGRMVATAFERRGWEVLLLGANVPSADLARSTRELVPEVVLLSVSQALFLRPAAEAIAALRAEWPELLILVGGLPFQSHPELASKIGADAMAIRASEAEQVARAWHAGRR